MKKELLFPNWWRNGEGINSRRIRRRRRRRRFASGGQQNPAAAGDGGQQEVGILFFSVLQKSGVASRSLPPTAAAAPINSSSHPSCSSISVGCCGRTLFHPSTNPQSAFSEFLEINENVAI